MSANIRIRKVLKELNVKLDRAVESLQEKGFDVDRSPNAKITQEQYDVLVETFQPDRVKKQESEAVSKELQKEKEEIRSEIQKTEDEDDVIKVSSKKAEFTVVDKIDLNKKDPLDLKKTEKTKTNIPKEEKLENKEETPHQKIQTAYKKLDGPKIAGDKIDLSQFEKKPKKKVASSNPEEADSKKKKRRRITQINKDRKKPKKKKSDVVEPSEEEIKKQIKETLEKLTTSAKSKGAKHRRSKRIEKKEQEEIIQQEKEQKGQIIKVTEFVTPTEFATMMNVEPNDIISSCMQLGFMVTLNQRLDAETLTIIAEEFGFKVEFVSAEVQESIDIVTENKGELTSRSPIVTVMGHVDHGKTSLLDYVRKANVIAGEAGGITQHIGAYEVEVEKGKKMTFIDTPGHEAFTAMRARGAQVTDIVIIVIAADDDIMPQTKEAISHAQAAGVPMVFAINKVDKPNADAEKIKEQLSSMNLLVEDWGGKYQSHDVSAKTGDGIKELLEKVLLEAELLELKASIDNNASGSVIEASLDKGKGYVTTILVQDGTLKTGDYLLAGQFSGKVKVMFNERGVKLKEAGPSCPVSLLGLNGAPQAGDTFNVMEDEKEAKSIANKRMQLQREQGVRTQKHVTLDEIGRRLALGEFKELNIILKGDVDGSIEALTDSLQKLSTDKVQVNIIHKAIGQITESDVLLASASDAVIIGFQVRPSATARKLAEKEQIDIRTYSIIYDAINEIRDAMEGMLSAEIKEEVVCTIEIRETFKISRIGTIAGCMVTDGKITRNTKVRLIRDGVVVYTGELGSLKRFKDDVKEVAKGFECGLNIANFNDIKVGDIVEGFEEVEIKTTLN